ncbi:hypothetical protein CANINC_003299 [Pichia inconspicua]|uniref:PCI domain-containing protein n=1 Tax=Pichia inconspicua TaxID=52247 RepID=A0A4T0WZ03_9ASCO|nr:hypothetical protein CANINC_003299 [[Candida] inconspicua]
MNTVSHFATKSNVDLVKSLSQVFENIHIDTLTSDTDFFKDCVSRTTSNLGQKWDKCFILLTILHNYQETVNVKMISLPMKGLISSYALDILSSIDFVMLYQQREFCEMFNNLLISNFAKCNEFQVQRLYESFLRCANCNSDKSLYFFQMFTVDQLFQNQLYSKIVYLIEEFKIADIESIGSFDERYINDNLFSYFHWLGYSLIIEGSSEHAYKLIMTALLVTNEKIELSTFHLLLTEIAYLTLKLNVPYENMSIIILKYRTKLLPRVLDILQNFYTYDYESFLCNYTLMVLHFKNKRQKLMLSLFTEKFLTFSIHQLLQNKASTLLRVCGSTSVDQIEDEFNRKIEEMNSKYAEYLISIGPFKIQREKTTHDRFPLHSSLCYSLGLVHSIMDTDTKT